MGSGKGYGKSYFARPFSLAATVVLGLVFGTPAQAARNPAAPCDQVQEEMTSLKVRANDLAVGIDPADDNTDDVIAEPIESESFGTDAPAPMLYLTPRVTSILEAVFDNHKEVSAVDDVEQEPGERDSPTTESGKAVKSAPVTVIDKEASVPRFQRHMYRNDI